MKLKSIESIRLSSKEPVYDLTVDGSYQSYSVSPSKIIVHNCTNALSTNFVILSKLTDSNYNKSISIVEKLYDPNNPNQYYFLEFSQGIKSGEGVITRDEVLEKYGFSFPEGQSTITAFIPDPEIWTEIKASYNKKSLHYVSLILDKFYGKKASIKIDGKEVTKDHNPFQFDFIQEISLPGTKLDANGDLIQRTAKFYVNFETSNDLNYSDVSGSINSLIVNQGIHINYAKKAYEDALKLVFDIQHDYILNGLKLNVVCISPSVDYSSQTKERCVKISDLTQNEIVDQLRNQFRSIIKKNREYFELHVQRLNELASSLTKISAIQKVKQVVGTLDAGNRTRSRLPSNVKDCSSENREECELMCCEGKSAEGSILQARDPKIHAVMSLRGVPINGVNLDLDSIMDNVEMKSIITAIGAGVNEYFEMDKCRYGKIILAADSDADGNKINSMILGFLAKKMTFLIESGKVFIALAPLYKQGDILVYPGEDFRTKIDTSKPFKRFKGIGEINPIEAREFYINPSTRKLLQVTMNNLEYVTQLLTLSYFRKDLMVSNNIITDPYNTGVL